MQPTTASPAITTPHVAASPAFSIKHFGARNELLATGLTPDTPPEDHPWSARDFALRDPNGVMFYIYSDREPAPEFRTAFLGGADA